jgi:hypothetical protein
VKTSSQWIENEPKEKWCVLHNTRGVRFGIKTTNFAEVYNTVLRGASCYPLVGIIEFFLYRTMKYFYERANKAHTTMADSQKLYSTAMTEYLDIKLKKALSHRAEPEPIHRASASDTRWKYLVECKAKSQKTGNERRRQIVVLGNTMCSCSCHKPQLLHKPCSHVPVACFRTKSWHWVRYVSRYYLKQTILDTWNHTLEGHLFISSFIEDPKGNATYIPDPNPELCQGDGRRKKKRIRNNMDEAEAGRSVALCSKCNNPGHTYKKCTATMYACNAPSSSNADHVAQPSTSGSAPSGRGRGRRSRRNEGMH